MTVPDLLSAIAALDEQLCLGSAGPLASDPVLIYNVITQTQAQALAASFSAATETVPIQLSCFSAKAELAVSGIEEGKALVLGLADDDIVRIQYLGMTGPTYLSSEREWRCTADFLITIAEDLKGS